MIAPQSTPSFSTATEILYFGTGYGWVWAYHTTEGWFQPAKLELGCPIVGSPLVIHDQGRDLVVVADRPNYPDEVANLDGRPLCPRKHGKIWVVQGLDDPTGSLHWRSYDASTSKFDDSGFGGFVTPSAVMAPPDGENPSFIIGTDGFDGGRAMRLALDRSADYKPYRVWTVDGSTGFAGNFTSDGTNAYWLDTAGNLWAASLVNGREPTGWPAYSIDLPALIGARHAFTNTEPAVEVRQTPDGPETHLYVTLRNYSDHPTGADLRAGPTGNDGAVVALGPGGQLKWFRRFAEADRLGEMKASLNTAPLVLASRGALFFGDVNGNIYSHALDSTNVNGGSPRPALIPPDGRTPTDRLTLLEDGEEPARGPFTFSQVSGVGVDPAFAHGLMLVGVNYFKNGQTSGRLVAYGSDEGYDLRWLDPPPSEPLLLPEVEPAPLQGQVQLELTEKPLSLLCDGSPAVQWYLTDSAGQLVRPLGEVPLPADLAPNQPYPVAVEVRLTASDPAEGQIVGIIDLPSVYALSDPSLRSGPLAQMRAIAQALGLASQKTCAGAAAEVAEREGFPGPDGGLANNVWRLPYARQTLVDDPFLMELAVPKTALAGDPIEVGVYLGYQNNLERSAAEVQFRLWARRAASDPAPVAGWEPVTIADIPCCTVETGLFDGLDEGDWELVAEIAYPGDTNPDNNRTVRTVRIQRLQESQGDGLEGGAITD